jgi:hypothetical protein
LVNLPASFIESAPSFSEVFATSVPLQPLISNIRRHDRSLHQALGLVGEVVVDELGVAGAVAENLVLEFQDLAAQPGGVGGKLAVAATQALLMVGELVDQLLATARLCAAMRLRLRRSSPGSLPLLPADEALPALLLAALAVSVGERRCLRELVASLGSGDSPSLLGEG